MLLLRKHDIGMSNRERKYIGIAVLKLTVFLSSRHTNNITSRIYRREAELKEVRLFSKLSR